MVTICDLTPLSQALSAYFMHCEEQNSEGYDFLWKPESVCESYRKSIVIVPEILYRYCPLNSQFHSPLLPITQFTILSTPRGF